MRKEKYGLLIADEPQSLTIRFDKPCHLGVYGTPQLIRSPMASIEMIAFHNFVPHFLIWLAPYPPPVRRHVGDEKVLFSLFRIFDELLHEIRVPESFNIMVPVYEKTLDLVAIRSAVIREYITPRVCVELHCLNLSVVRHVAKVNDCINIFTAKMLQSGNEILSGIKPIPCASIP